MKNVMLKKVFPWVLVVFLSFLAGCIVIPVGHGHGGWGHGYYR